MLSFEFRHRFFLKLLAVLPVFEETEIHIPITPMVGKVGVKLKTVFRGVFEYEKSIRL